MSSIKKALTASKEGDVVGAWAMLVQNKLNGLFVSSREHENRYGLHASSILDSENEFCYREQVLSLSFEQNQGEQLPVRVLRIFAQGNAMHEKWYKLFEQQGISIAIERSLFLEKYDLSFTIDALLDLFNEEVVCDIKSQNSFLYKKSKGHPKGEAQVNFYVWALSKYTGTPHRKGFVLVDNKDTQEIQIVPVTYNKEKVKPYVERLKKVQEYKKEFIDTGKLPPKKNSSPESKRCSECNMRDACHLIGKGRVPLAK